MRGRECEEARPVRSRRVAVTTATPIAREPSARQKVFASVIWSTALS